ncbi:GFA family protein, partial [Klebsiella pneumoniae]|uniref:GFA family protein n=1 Tax=Klebsiella pneumoniae TaxID=573 RepID=UPI001953836C
MAACAVRRRQNVTAKRTTMADIQCPCGAVHMRINGEPIAQFWCHCADCQRVHGAAYVAESLYPADAVEV